MSKTEISSNEPRSHTEARSQPHDARIFGAVGLLHSRYVFQRRVDVLSNWFARLIPEGARVLDVGCGDGLVSALLCSKRPDIAVRGIDVVPRSQTHIPVELFDGSTIPFPGNSFDGVIFSDVLHHTEDPRILLREAVRVSASSVLIKDHFRKGLAAAQRLRLMDWVGNARFGVALPYNYWTETQWHSAWQELHLEPEEIATRLGLYAVPADWLFGAQLHFVTRLKKLTA
jgi:SAM-dependent methyltransferase